jgi:hypothetical protein
MAASGTRRFCRAPNLCFFALAFLFERMPSADNPSAEALQTENARHNYVELVDRHERAVTAERKLDDAPGAEPCYRAIVQR